MKGQVQPDVKSTWLPLIDEMNAELAASGIGPNSAKGDDGATTKKPTPDVDMKVRAQPTGKNTRTLIENIRTMKGIIEGATPAEGSRKRKIAALESSLKTIKKQDNEFHYTGNPWASRISMTGLSSQQASRSGLPLEKEKQALKEDGEEKDMQPENDSADEFDRLVKQLGIPDPQQALALLEQTGVNRERAIEALSKCRHLVGY